MTELTKQERGEVVANCLRRVWGSLDSHLDWAQREGLPDPDNGDFHKECVLDYITLMQDIAKLY